MWIYLGICLVMLAIFTYCPKVTLLFPYVVFLLTRPNRIATASANKMISNSKEKLAELNLTI